MKKNDVSGFITDYLILRGVTHVFGMLGHGNLHTGQALKDRAARIKFVPFRHEQNAGYAAAAYARFTGRAAALCVSNGPGAASLPAALAEARISRLPVLVIAGETALRGASPMLQELEPLDGKKWEPAECLKPFACFWEKLEDPADLPAVLDAAFEAMYRPGREGPAVISLPLDLQRASCPGPSYKAVPRKELSPAPDLLKRAAALIAGAKRPFIVAGGGVIRAGAWEELRRLCEAAAMPAGQTQSGNGALLFDHPLNLFGLGVQGSACANNIAAKADLIILAGTRLTDFTTGSGKLLASGAKVISVNISGLDNDKISGLKLAGDARAVLGALAALVVKSKPRSARAEYLREIAAQRSAWLKTVAGLSAPCASGALTQLQVIAALAGAAAPGATVLTSTGSLSGDLFKLWPCRDAARRGYYVPFGFSSMGSEIACALGVKLADPRRKLYALAGDASFLLGHQELTTMAQEGVEAVIIVADNGGARSIERQQAQLGFDKFANELRRRGPAALTGAPLAADCALMAEGCGAAAYRASTLAEFNSALALADKVKGRPAVIHVKTSPELKSPAGGWPLDLPGRSAPAAEAAAAPRQVRDLDKMIRAARAGQEKWAALSLPRRSAVLEKAARLLAGRSRAAAAVISAETGKPAGEAARDCERAADALSFFAAAAPGYLAPETQTTAEGLRVALCFEPRGVVGAIKPWNFPLDLPLWSCAAPALMAGNAVILKPSPLTPRSGALLEDLLDEAGLPAGVFQIFNGGDREGRTLVRSGVDMISFTGSSAAGGEIARACADAGKPCSLELGGKDAAVVFEDCDLGAAADMIMRGAFLNSGQVCSGIKRVIAHEKIFPALVSRLALLMEELPPMKLARQEDLENVTGLLRRAPGEGCVLLAGASPVSAGLLRPALLACGDQRAEAWTEEIFGPVLAAASFGSNARALELLNASKYGLGVSVWTRSEVTFEEIARGARAGMVFWNGIPRPVLEGIWTGRGQSGEGCSLGKYGTREFTVMKQLVLPPAQGHGGGPRRCGGEA